MKYLTRILMVLVFVGLVMGSFAALVKAADEVKKEETVKYCCPMCKKVLTPEEAKFKAEYKNNTYYFCCEKCKAEFEKDPEKCLKTCKAHEQEVYYVCPMKEHDVKSDKPGKCPKCGMELKKVTAPVACCKHEEGKTPCCKHQQAQPQEKKDEQKKE